MKTFVCALVAMLLGVTAFRIRAQEKPSLVAGQSVYIVALDTSSRRADTAGGSLELERKAREEFEKERKFKVASVLKTADFVFVIALDRAARDSDEVAIAISPGDYMANSDSFEKMRDAAIWQGSAHFKRGKHTAIAAASLGYSKFFDHSSVVKGLIKQFHKEVL